MVFEILVKNCLSIEKSIGTMLRGSYILWHYTRNIFFTVLFLFITLLVNGTNYYVSNSGNDSNAGTSESLAWKTISKVNSFYLKPGDQVLFKRGDSWKGTLRPLTSGTSGSAIVYGAYGAGSDPIITGFTTVTTWTNKGGNIWESTNAVSTQSTCNMVVINGVNTPMGRTPNSGYYYFQSQDPASGTITSNNLGGTPNWTGADIVVQLLHWQFHRVLIKNQSGGTITYEKPYLSRQPYENNLKFIIQNDIRTLDSPNEWYYSSSNQKLSVYSTSKPTNVQIATIDKLLVVTGKDHIIFKELAFEGSHTDCVSLTSTDYITFDSCTFRNIGEDGIQGELGGSTTGTLIKNCSLSEINNTAIALSNIFEDATIRNNTIHNVGMNVGGVVQGGKNGSGNGMLHAISVNGINPLIEYNSISNIGYMGINFRKDNTIIRYNHVDRFCQLLTDGAGIYTWNEIPSGVTHTGIEIYNNILSNGATEKGIYLDSEVNGVSIHDNVIFGCVIGVFLHNIYNIDLRNNTFFDNDYGVYMSNNLGRIPFRDVNITDNIVVARNTSQYPFRGDYVERIIPYINSDYNYFCRPIDSDKTFDVIVRQPFSRSYYALGGWQSYSGQDINSHGSPVAITSEDDIQFEYNITKSSKTISLSRPMIDMKGTKYATSVTLSPYSSVILIKDPDPEENPAPSPTGSTQGNTEVYGTTTYPANRRAVPVTFDESGAINSISVFHDGGTGNVLLGVYSDQNGSPGDLLGLSSSTAVNSVEGWQTVSLENLVAVNTGQTVWLSWLFEKNPGIRFTAGTPGRAESTETWTGGMPSSFGTSTFADYKYSIYCNYIDQDVTIPEVSVFSIPATSTSLNISISAFIATDNIGVNKYLLTENSSTPSPEAFEWSSTKPTTYTFASSGTKTLYAWAIDEAGNVSNGVSGQVTINLPSNTTNTLGNTEIYETTTYSPNLRAMPVTFDESGTITSISVFHEGGTGDVLLGVYSDQSGSPGELLGVSSSTAVNSTEGWQTISLKTPVEVSISQKVWLSWLFENTPGIKFTAGTPGRAESSGTWTDGMASTFGIASISNFNYSIYCNYVPETNLETKSLGYTEVYETTTYSSNLRAMPVTFDESGNINSISVFHDGGTGNVLLGVYSDKNGSPGELLGISSSTAVNSVAGWQTLTLENPVAVNASQIVWLSWLFENNPGIRFTAGTPGRAESSGTWASGMTTNFEITNYADYNYSLYCNYTVTEHKQINTLGNTEAFDFATLSPERRAIPVEFNEAGQIQSISIYHKAGAGNVLMGVYSDVSGRPTSLLGVTPSTTVRNTEGWQTIYLTAPVNVSEGQKVWLAWVFQNTSFVRYQVTNTPESVVANNSWSSQMPSAFGFNSKANFKFSVHCNYTVNSLLKDATISENEKIEFTSFADKNNQSEKVVLGDPIKLTEQFDFKLYPNPSKSFINIDFKHLPETETMIVIVDSNGRIILNQKVVSNSNKIDINQFPSGIYYLKSVNQLWSKTKKMIIVK